MDIQPIYWSERQRLHNESRKMEQPFPFFNEQQKSRDSFWQTAKKKNAWRVKAGKLVLYFEKKTGEASESDHLVITNVLANESFRQWRQLFTLLESCARYFLKSACQFSFSQPLSSQMTELFIQFGYQTVDTRTTQWVKNVSGKSAVVFGGGGAHGAYQIGVWKALQEAGFSIELITGTSVGAINGVLMLQGDLDQAEFLWTNLSTNQILAVPENVPLTDLRQQLLTDIRRMTKTAVLTRGISSQPLEELLRKSLDLKSIVQKTKPQLFTVTTKIPEMIEKVVPIQKMPPEQIPEWIVASASFYPAMAYKKIDKDRYIDGGYKNNLPVDVAIEQGATEAFVVDVQGPGITKRVKKPLGFVEWRCRSLWTLGTFLIFDGQRNSMNLQLGYLETKKQLHQYEGHWYTFDSTVLAEKIWKKFLRTLAKEKNLELSFFYDVKFWENLRNVYKDRVVIETCGLAMLELLAKQMYLLPNKVYQVPEMITLIREKEQRPFTEIVTNEIGLLSMEEWCSSSREQRLEQKLTELAKELYASTKEKVQTLLKEQPLNTLFVLYAHYLKEEQEWHKNFPMKS